MSITISANSNTVGGLFSSMNSNLLNTKNNAFSGLGMMGGFSYSDYASIRNGSYHKLLSSYYSLDSVDSGSKASSSTSGTSGTSGSTSRTYNYWTKDGMVQRTYDTGLVTRKTGTTGKASTSTSKETAAKLADIESSAEKLNDAANTLLTQGTKSLFNKVTTTDKDGNKTTGYNTDAIYKAVSDYAAQYNKLVNQAGSSNVLSIRASAASIMDYSKANEKALSEIGISIDPEKKTMTVDEEKFKSADMNEVKKLFQGSGSYAYQVASKASSIDYQAQYEAQKSSTYNSGGAYSYNYSAGSVWNGMV